MDDVEMAATIERLKKRLDAETEFANILLAEVESLAGCENCERMAEGYGQICSRSGDGLEDCESDVCSDYGCDIVTLFPQHIGEAITKYRPPQSEERS